MTDPSASTDADRARVIPTRRQKLSDLSRERQRISPGENVDLRGEGSEVTARLFSIIAKQRVIIN